MLNISDGTIRHLNAMNAIKEPAAHEKPIYMGTFDHGGRFLLKTNGACSVLIADHALSFDAEDVFTARRLCQGITHVDVLDLSPFYRELNSMGTWQLADLPTHAPEFDDVTDSTLFSTPYRGSVLDWMRLMVPTRFAQVYEQAHIMASSPRISFDWMCLLQGLWHVDFGVGSEARCRIDAYGRGLTFSAELQGGDGELRAHVNFS